MTYIVCVLKYYCIARYIALYGPERNYTLLLRDQYLLLSCSTSGEKKSIIGVQWMGLFQVPKLSQANFAKDARCELCLMPISHCH